MPSSPSAADRAFLTRQPFAHRGLHGPGRVENSRAAFHAAIAAGQGIELDVQIARCGTPIVFHDERLERLTGAAGTLTDHDATALSRIRLAGTDEPIPTLAEILALVGDQAPLLIEVKARLADAGRLAAAVAALADGHRGEAAIMSFNPQVCRWLAAHAPHRVRGLVASGHDRSALHGPAALRLTEMLARPHFLALDVRDLPSAQSRRARARGVPVLTWTVRSDDDRATARLHADQIIHEEQPPSGR